MAVVCSPTDEGHELPGLMAGAAFRERHWRVRHLGAREPVGSVEGLVATNGSTWS